MLAMNDREADEFRRIQLHTDVERATLMITKYREGIDHYRDQLATCHKKLATCHKKLGRIAERLGEPEEGH